MMRTPRIVGAVLLWCLPLAAASAGDQPGGYVVAPPPESEPTTTDWSFHARVQGAGPADDHGSTYWRRGEVSAGFGWREPGSFVLFGYEQGGRDASPPPLDFSLPGGEGPWQPSHGGVLGLSIKLGNGDGR